MAFASVMRPEEEKIAEVWTVWDNLVALTQLGHLEMPGGPSDGAQPWRRSRPS